MIDRMSGTLVCNDTTTLMRRAQTSWSTLQDENTIYIVDMFIKEKIRFLSFEMKLFSSSKCGLTSLKRLFWTCFKSHLTTINNYTQKGDDSRWVTQHVQNFGFSAHQHSMGQNASCWILFFLFRSWILNMFRAFRAWRWLNFWMFRCAHAQARTAPKGIRRNRFVVEKPAKSGIFALGGLQGSFSSF